MTEALFLLTERDFWYFNKESIALAIVVAACSGVVFGLFHEAGEALWHHIKNKVGK